MVTIMMVVLLKVLLNSVSLVWRTVNGSDLEWGGGGEREGEKQKKEAKHWYVLLACPGEKLVYDIFEWKIVGRNLFALFMLGIFFFLLNILIEYKFFIKWRSVEAENT